MNLKIDHSFEERKADLIVELFIAPGDEDYLAARWSYDNGNFRTFPWLAAQAIEKYLKAALLFQSVSVKDFGHNLNDLFKAVASLDQGGNIPQRVSIPGTVAAQRDPWNGKPTWHFVDYLNVYGSPGNRYLENGKLINGPVMHALDQLAHSIRCLIRIENPFQTQLFEVLSRNDAEKHLVGEPKPWMIKSELPLERLFCGRFDVGRAPDARRVFSNMNMAFFPAQEQGASTFGGFATMGSPLYKHLVHWRKLDDSLENQLLIDNMSVWIDEHIQVSKPVWRELLKLQGKA